MRIGELSKKTGCKIVTIRYYEQEGLLASPSRTEGNYRRYGPDDLDRLEFILHCRKHGMALDEIRKLLAFRDHPQRDCTWISELVGKHIKNVDEQIHALEALKRHLEKLKARCSGESRHGVCGIIQGLAKPELCCDWCEQFTCCKKKHPTQQGDGDGIHDPGNV